MKKTFATFAAMVFAGALGTVAMAQGGYGQGIGATQVNRFDNGYLDEHPEVARQLGHNPALVDNSQFMADHPGLRDYFANHPGVRADIKEHPYRFMNDEWKHDAWHQPGYGRGIGAAQVNRFDNGYLDEHPEVAQQLGHNPALVDNPRFMADHPGLHEYFENHPEVRADLKDHPDRFMNDEWRHDQWHNRGGYAHPLANTDHYLDQHPEASQQLNAHPGLVDDPKYVQNHPGLHEFLGTHPVAKTDWKNHPRRFMLHEQHYNQKH
ncbi:MAG: hypothetical protein ACREQR_15985 [Candidatus Binataceae bacterium]